MQTYGVSAMPATQQRTTEVTVGTFPRTIDRNDCILSLGSCFSTEMSKRLSASGYEVCDNPFGVLYNPASIARALLFLAEGHTFTPDDVIPRDTNPKRKDRTGNHVKQKTDRPAHRPIAPDGGGYVSFFHHGSFARKSPEEFLEHANRSLLEASEQFRKSKWILATFGTAWTYRHIAGNIIVANCHKHPAWEFRRELMDADSISSLWSDIVRRFSDKTFVFTVSPIRHKKDGMHGNQISKATLLLALEKTIREAPAANACYFPSYEIILDELRDYRWYNEDLVHPSSEAIDIVWQRFQDTLLSRT